VRPIKVRSAARHADGTATDLKRTQPQRCPQGCLLAPTSVDLTLREVCRKNFASDVVPVDGAWIIAMVAIESVLIRGIASHVCGSAVPLHTRQLVPTTGVDLASQFGSARRISRCIALIVDAFRDGAERSV
jgi:hypothetical protein